MRIMDWMIQVYRVLNKSCPQTFFIATNVIDTYFTNSREQGVVLRKEDLHLIGISAVLISSKIEDVIPIFMDQILEDACHGKFQRH